MRVKSETKLVQIFEATLRLTEKVGIAGLKMSAIAKEAGMASGTLYLYFENKEDLLNSLYLKLQKEGASAIVHQISHLPINVQFYKMWTIALKALVNNNYRIVFLEQFLISPYITSENKNKNLAFNDYLKRLLDRGKKNNSIKKADTDMLIALILGFIRNFSIHISNDQSITLTNELIDNSFSLCWDAIKK